MTVAIVQFGGSNCDRDAKRALAEIGVDAELVWHEDGLPEDATGVMLPGGFSYGDYLRAGAIAANSPIMAEVREAAEDGLPLLGVCNGAQIGCESRLTPGAFTTNESARFQCERIHVRVENADTPWTRHYDEGEVVELPIAHGEGRFEITDDELAELEDENRVLFRYCDEDGEVSPEANPNGSKGNVAGIAGERENVAVLMPHPERISLPDIGGTDGQGILRGFES
ncbi:MULTISPECIES: phosphoribosylformylglycinamidine synthase I [Halorussus]|uniref:phosphoribosylformylglycinamidine synthase I n=1 Tax=Halorussus TaxID=1070314 RepID=UPI0020A14C6A|nr:phosphoribosylformylglycinamidine synthase I [Halorussus vallis]USZ77516.1 phosphoribosylformylglycinamidine synthase I [Halorussus vallis]